MRVFIDANVIISVLNKEYPLFPYSARVLSLTQNKRFSLYTSPVCLAIAFYFAEKKYGSAVAKQKISLLLKNIGIAEVGIDESVQSANDKRIEDFEDGLQYYAAKKQKCKAIITEDIEDFYFSEIEIIGSKAFLEKFLF